MVEEKFDIEYVKVNFERCIADNDDDILLEFYLDSYREILK
jgi:hypothetical protein